jgi:hypothetical protein
MRNDLGAEFPGDRFIAPAGRQFCGAKLTPGLRAASINRPG